MHISNSDKKELNRRLRSVMAEINNAEEGKIEINGTTYSTVALRNKKLREEFGFEIKIIPDLIHVDNVKVIAKASIYILMYDEWVEVAVGHSEEYRREDPVNRISATENAETSAIGRALAVLGLSGNEGMASGDEIITKVEASQDSTTAKDVKTPKTQLRTASQKKIILELEEKTKTPLDELVKKMNLPSGWTNKNRFLDNLTLLQAGEIINAYNKIVDELSEDTGVL